MIDFFSGKTTKEKLGKKKNKPDNNLDKKKNDFLWFRSQKSLFNL